MYIKILVGTLSGALLYSTSLHADVELLPGTLSAGRPATRAVIPPPPPPPPPRAPVAGTAPHGIQGSGAGGFPTASATMTSIPRPKSNNDGARGRGKTIDPNGQGLNQAQIDAMEAQRRLMWNATGAGMVYR